MINAENRITKLKTQDVSRLVCVFFFLHRSEIGSKPQNIRINSNGNICFFCFTKNLIFRSFIFVSKMQGKNSRPNNAHLHLFQFDLFFLLLDFFLSQYLNLIDSHRFLSSFAETRPKHPLRNIEACFYAFCLFLCSKSRIAQFVCNDKKKITIDS